jgi:hypothetical protein
LATMMWNSSTLFLSSFLPLPTANKLSAVGVSATPVIFSEKSSTISPEFILSYQCQLDPSC